MVRTTPGVATPAWGDRTQLKDPVFYMEIGIAGARAWGRTITDNY